MAASLTSLGLRLGLRRRGFRVYLTVVYGGLFLASGTGLLGLTYWLADTRFPVTGQALGHGPWRPWLPAGAAAGGCPGGSGAGHCGARCRIA